MNEAELFHCLDRTVGIISLYVENIFNLAVIGCQATEKAPLVSFFDGKWRSIADFRKNGKGFVLEYVRIEDNPEEFRDKLLKKAENYGKMVDKWIEMRKNATKS